MLQDRATVQMMGSILLPPIERRELHAHTGESGIWLYEDLDVEPVQEDVPVDFYLREARDLDLDDMSAVAGFLDAWGLPVDPLNRDLLGGESRSESWARDTGTLADSVRDLSDGRTAAAVELGWVDEDWRTLPLAQRLADPARGHAEAAAERRLVNLGEVTLRLFVMQGFIDVVMGDSNQHPDDDARLIDDLNAALNPFMPRVVWGEQYTSRPTIYNVVAAQIINDLYDGATISTCLNETCGRKFTKQRGRAEYGVHRSKGVLYCSKTCAKAQAQRELRRRRRTDKGNHHGEA